MLDALFKLITASDEDKAKMFSSWLTERGWTVDPPGGPWETEGDFCARHKISPDTFLRKFRRHGHKLASDVEYGESGRVIRLRSNQKLDLFFIGTNASILRDSNGAVVGVVIEDLPPKKKVSGGLFGILSA